MAILENPLLKKLIEFARADSALNLAVKDEMLTKNVQRIIGFEFVTILVNLLMIAILSFGFHPTSATEAWWSNHIVMLHSLSAAIVMLMCFITLYGKRKDYGLANSKIVQNIFFFYILAFGIALVTVDQAITSNITPFLLVCTIMGVFILNRPIDAFFQYLAAYILFFIAIGQYQIEPAVLTSNRLNGLVFVVIGIFATTIIWYSERNSILQKQKILEQQKKLESAAYYDDLTGLINRRKWIELLKEEYERMKRYHHLSSMLLLDIDNFKGINDQYGHPAGDRILQEIATLVKNELRICDRIGRWGGEEFIILLVETPIKNGIAVAEKIKNEIEEMSIQIESHLIKVTISIGVASLDCEKDFSTSYKKADQALYLAKNNGRNRVEFIQ
ncbi:diguanylate cyclase [Acetobacterium paludosum]|uniref:Diguanylate cyclase n=1 Tax=Acetobacterium paludosum TaxID=52693 RepID=A0A923HUE8_9FIRM|nr:GGDEF domain-containing protein [Acetobacterium paludosum]MBC3887382.1 diguanylate cyclase [Acetobacterium paludosum]